MPMKRILVVLALTLTASTALAAAPAQPQFNAPVKIGEGQLGRAGNRPVISGTTLYATFGADRMDSSGWSGPDSVRLVKSTNSGATWDLSTALASADWVNSLWVDTSSARVAVSNDPAATGQKLVHAIWLTTGQSSTLYYSYFRTAAPAAGWSAPVVTPAGQDEWLNGPTLIVTSGGVIHVFADAVGRIFHFSAPSAGQPFGPVDVLPVPAGTLNLGEPSVALDAAGTFHVAFVQDNTNLYYTKKTTGASAWSTPKLIFGAPGSGNMGNNIGLALADASNAYVVFHEGDSATYGNLRLATSTNGGTAWTLRVVATGLVYNRSNWPSIVATASKIVTFAMEVPSADDSSQVVKVWRTNAVDSTWAPVVTLARGQENPSLALDASNKVHVLVRDEARYNPAINGNLLWIKEK